MNYNEIIEVLKSENPDALLATGFEGALVGITQQFNKSLALYDLDLCVMILMERDMMSEEEAMEFLDYNVVGSYVGDNTPCFCILWK